MIHVQLWSSLGKMRDKFLNEFHHLEKENPTGLHTVKGSCRAHAELSPLIISDDRSFMCHSATPSDLNGRCRVYTGQIVFQVCSNNCLLYPISSGWCLHTTFEGSFGRSTKNWEKASTHLGPSKGWTQAYKVSTWHPNNSLNIIISSKGKKPREQGLEAMFESCSGETACSSGHGLYHCFPLGSFSP